MSTPIPLSGRLADAQARPKTPPPAIASMASAARAAANDGTHSPDDDHTVNPLWMITIGLGILFAVMGLFLATS
jgi:hypothetical protein